MSFYRIGRKRLLHIVSLIGMLACLLQGCAYRTSKLQYPWPDVLDAALQKARVVDPDAVLVHVYLLSAHQGTVTPPLSYSFTFAKADNTILDMAFNESSSHPALHLIGSQGSVFPFDRIATMAERERVRTIWSMAMITPDSAFNTAATQLPPDISRETPFVTLDLLAGSPIQQAEHAQVVWNVQYIADKTTFTVVIDALTGAVLRTSR